MMDDVIVRQVPLTKFGKLFNGLALFNLYDQEGDEIHINQEDFILLVGNEHTHREKMPVQDIMYLHDLGWQYDEKYECWFFFLS